MRIGKSKGKCLFPVVLGLVVSFGMVRAVARTNAYQQTNLASDLAGMANHIDPKLINPWGISFFPGLRDLMATSEGDWGNEGCSENRR